VVDQVKILANVGRLKKGYWYQVDREGRDWYQIKGLYVDKSWTTTEWREPRRQGQFQDE